MTLLGLPPAPAASVRREEEVFDFTIFKPAAPSQTETVPSARVILPTPQYALYVGASHGSQKPVITDVVVTQGSRLARSLQAQRDPLIDLMLQLDEVGRDTDEDLPLTPHAQQRATLLLSVVAQELPKGGILIGDSVGGLRVKWYNGERHILLFIHASQEREDYVYWREGERYNITTPVTAPLLTSWLRWLRGDIQ